MQKRRCILIFLGLFLFSAFINFSLRYILHGDQNLANLDADEQEYFLLSGEILDGTYDFPTRRTLGHVLIVTFIRLFTGDNLSALLITISCFSSLVSPLLYMVVRTAIRSDGIAFLAGVIAALWPSYIYFGGTLYSEASALPFFLLFLLVLFRALQRDFYSEKCGWIFTGIFLGLCIHIRPMYLFFIPFLLVILALKLTCRRAIQATLFFSLGLMIIILPWSLYISSRNHKFILLSTNGGETLAGSFNSKLAQGYYKGIKSDNEIWVIGPGKWTPNPGYLTKEEENLPADIKDSLLIHKALEWSIEHPEQVARLEAAKLVYMWTGFPYFDKINYLKGTLPLCIIILLSLLSWIFYGDRRGYPWIFWMLPLFVSLVALVSWGSWRFRQPGDLGLIVLSAYFLFYFGKRIFCCRKAE